MIGKVAVSRNGRPRAVGDVIMIVNPVDYWQRVMPATTIQRPDGTFANNVLPYPTEVVQSEEVPSGKAVMGIAGQYFMGIGTGKDGVIEYDDSYKFLQRERVYAAYLYGNGKPKDNNSFLVLDISELQPATYAVYAATGATETVEKTTWTESELNDMTVAQIEGLAAYMKYTIEGSTKAEKIASFLEQQAAATE